MPPVSKIAQMPAEVREWLHKTFVDRAFGDIVSITEELNAKLREGGVATYVGKSAVGAESQKVKRAQEVMRATTEAAKLMSESSRDDGNARGEAIMGMVEAEMFECMLQIRETEALDDPVDRVNAMSKAAKNIATLSRARVSQSQWRLELEGRIKAVADRVEKLAKKGGMDARTVQEIRTNILGIKNAPQKVPPESAK